MTASGYKLTTLVASGDTTGIAAILDSDGAVVFSSQDSDLVRQVANLMNKAYTRGREDVMVEIAEVKAQIKLEEYGD